MRVTKTLARSVIGEVIGEDAVPAFEAIFRKKEVSEFTVAKLYDDNINIARNVLYRMSNENLVTFIKKKDKVKGWYVYYWTLNPKRILELDYKVQKTKVHQLKKRLEREKDHLFFVCCNKCVRLDFEKATDFEFKCPECSSILSEDDNTETISMIEQELARLKNSISA